MGTKIVITEEQYRRLFLSEQVKHPEQNCSYMLPNNFRKSEHDIPFYFTLNDPFGDGYDYQYKVWDDCSRSWIRRKKSFRNKGVQDFMLDWDFAWKPSESEKQKLFKKKTEYYNSLKSSSEKILSSENLKKDIDREVAWMKSLGWTIKRYGGDNPTLKDVYLTNHMSALYTIRDIVQNGESWNPRFAAVQGGQSCLTVKTSDIGTYSIDNAKKYQENINKVIKNPGANIVGQGGDVPYGVYQDENGLPVRVYQTITNVPGNTYYLEDFYFMNPKILDDAKSIDPDYGGYNTPLFPNGIRGFLTTWFGTDNVKQFKYDSGVASRPFCNGKYVSFVGTLPSADVNIHDVLQIAAAFAWIIPGGQGVALGLEAIDAGIYFYEGDSVGGILGLAFVLIPGGMPLLRRLNRSGIKKVESIMVDTEKYIKSNPKISKQELAEYISNQKQVRKLTTEESKAFDEVLSNSKKIDSELGKINQMSKSQRTKFLSEKSKEFDKIWNKNVGWSEGSKYWERQIEMGNWGKLVIPSLYIGAVIHRNMTVDDAVIELNNAGFENVTKEDVEILIKDIGYKFEKFNPEEFKIIPTDPSKQQLIVDINNILTIVNKVGVNSNIYKEKVKPNINDSEILYDIYYLLNNDKQLKDIEYRNLSEDVDYKWYNTLDCKEDPYSRIEINIGNESELLADDFQNKIDEEGEVLELRGDSKYEYRLYKGYWFWKLKESNNKWKLLKNCLGCSKLQRAYNAEIEELLNQFDFENELNKELEK